MPIAEYKHHINHMGRIEVPGWVTDRGYYYRDSDHTYLGYVKDSSDREYLIPDTVNHLTKAECVSRQLEIHAARPMRHVAVDSDGIAMTTAEVTAEVESWYDAIVLKND